LNATTSGIYRNGWAALAVKALGRASGDETQTRVVDEPTNSGGPTFAKFMTMAERELGGATRTAPCHPGRNNIVATWYVGAQLT
jgi:hypothetical protein